MRRWLSLNSSLEFFVFAAVLVGDDTIMDERLTEL